MSFMKKKKRTTSQQSEANDSVTGSPMPSSRLGDKLGDDQESVRTGSKMEKDKKKRFAFFRRGKKKTGADGQPTVDDRSSVADTMSYLGGELAMSGDEQQEDAQSTRQKPQQQQQPARQSQLSVDLKELEEARERSSAMRTTEEMWKYASTTGANGGDGKHSSASITRDQENELSRLMSVDEPPPPSHPPHRQQHQSASSRNVPAVIVTDEHETPITMQRRGQLQVTPSMPGATSNISNNSASNSNNNNKYMSMIKQNVNKSKSSNQASSNNLNSRGGGQPMPTSPLSAIAAPASQQQQQLFESVDRQQPAGSSKYRGQILDNVRGSGSSQDGPPPAAVAAATAAETAAPRQQRAAQSDYVAVPGDRSQIYFPKTRYRDQIRNNVAGGGADGGGAGKSADLEQSPEKSLTSAQTSTQRFEPATTQQNKPDEYTAFELYSNSEYGAQQRKKYMSMIRQNNKGGVAAAPKSSSSAAAAAATAATSQPPASTVSGGAINSQSMHPGGAAHSAKSSFINKNNRRYMGQIKSNVNPGDRAHEAATSRADDSYQPAASKLPYSPSGVDSPRVSSDNYAATSGTVYSRPIGFLMPTNTTPASSDMPTDYTNSSGYNKHRPYYSAYHSAAAARPQSSIAHIRSTASTGTQTYGASTAFASASTSSAANRYRPATALSSYSRPISFVTDYDRIERDIFDDDDYNTNYYTSARVVPPVIRSRASYAARPQSQTRRRAPLLTAPSNFLSPKLDALKSDLINLQKANSHLIDELNWIKTRRQQQQNHRQQLAQQDAMYEQGGFEASAPRRAISFGIHDHLYHLPCCLYNSRRLASYDPPHQRATTGAPPVYERSRSVLSDVNHNYGNMNSYDASDVYSMSARAKPKINSETSDYFDSLIQKSLETLRRNNEFLLTPSSTQNQSNAYRGFNADYAVERENNSTPDNSFCKRCGKENLNQQTKKLLLEQRRINQRLLNNALADSAGQQHHHHHHHYQKQKRGSLARPASSAAAYAYSDDYSHKNNGHLGLWSNSNSGSVKCPVHSLPDPPKSRYSSLLDYYAHRR